MDTVIVSNGQFYSHYPKNIAKGTVDAEAVLIRLDSEWDNLTVRIHWLNVASNVEKKPLLERDQPNTIPWEVLTELGELRMGLVGLDGETVIKPTIWLTYGYVSDGVDPEAGDDPQPPTPSWPQQVLEQARAAAEAAEEAKDAAVNAEKAASQAGPYADEAKKSAEAAKKAQDAAATSAQEAGNAKDQANTAATTAQGHADAAGTSKVAAERAAETAGNAQSEAAQSAKSAANSAKEAEDANLEAQKAAAIIPAPTQENAGKFLMANPTGDGYIFGEVGGGKIDDSTLGRDTTWSSKMIVDSLAPAFEESGSVVTCNPVFRYPLSVMSQIVPVQEGKGDPSPENVRPISGWNEATIWKSGENLVNQDLAKNGSIGTEGGKLSINESATYGVYLSCNVNGNIPFLTFLGEYDGGASGRWKICFTDENNNLIPFTYTYNYPFGGTSTTFLDASGNSVKRLAVLSNFNGASKLWVCATDGRKTPPIITVVAGAVPNVAYSKYSGESITLAFGNVVYGGKLNWTTGELIIDWVKYIATGDENPGLGQENQTVKRWYFAVPIPTLGNAGSSSIVCDKLKTLATSSQDLVGCLCTGSNLISVLLPKDTIPDSDAVKEWLKTNRPEFAYKTSKIETIQLATTEILALSGVNTLYTDTGDTVVSGREDPSTTINALKKALSSTQSTADEMNEALEMILSGGD